MKGTNILHTDAILKGPVWHNTLEKLVGTVFETQWDVYALCITVGMMYDAQINDEDMVPDGYELKPATVGRTVLGNAPNRSLIEFMLKTSIVTTKHLDLNEDERLELAFSEDKELSFNPVRFLTKYANYGVTKISEVISDSDGVEILENLMTFLNSTYESGMDNVEDFMEIDDLEDDFDTLE